MSQKVAKPTLTGQRIKTRKRDEKEKYDPAGFRDSILLGLKEAGNDLEAVSKFLDVSGSKLDYRRYAETLFDILLAGGILAPGGSIQVDPDPTKDSCTDVCVFTTADDLEALKGFAQVFYRLIRRYKYLEKLFEDEMKKVLVFLKGFSDCQRHKLAKITAILLANEQLPATVLFSLFQDHLVKAEIALEFVLEVFEVWMNEKDANHITTALRKAELHKDLKEFFPANKRNQEHFEKLLIEKGLESLVKFQVCPLLDNFRSNLFQNLIIFKLSQKAQDDAGVKHKLVKQVCEMIQDNSNIKEIISTVKKQMEKNNLIEPDVIVMLWNTVMGAVEWNKKEELVAEQALKHLKQHTQLLAAFTSSETSELALMTNVQKYCYDNMNFMKVFHKIIVLFYKTDVVGEDAILKWFKDAHSNKGKSIFLEQIKKFVEWLQNAEEGNFNILNFSPVITFIESESSDED
ncbi:Basic leucine zipper and W2 domain-containing protein 2 [Nymphon striatum]|nr:Basic leucine zipper and W2 domain-containing protein 2 [Nymphon striatum]